MVRNKPKKPLGHKIWFKIVLTILAFLPSLTQIPYNQANTTDVIASVMAHPLIASVPLLLPVAKLILLLALVLPIFFGRLFERVFMGYYCLFLLLAGILQNMSSTAAYGFVWLLGNTCVQFSVLFYCLYDFFRRKTIIKMENVDKKRFWVVVPMLLAFLMPYSVNISGVVKPAFTTSVLWNEAGVTYCMVTPVILGIMILFSKGVHKPVLSVVSYVGLIFGLLNMVTWFCMQTENWWMGILHLPLLTLSFYGLIIARKDKPVTMHIP